jgi:hypothetical protein
MFTAELIRKGVIELWGHDGFDGLILALRLVKDRVSDRVIIGALKQDLAKPTKRNLQARPQKREKALKRSNSHSRG